LLYRPEKGEKTRTIRDFAGFENCAGVFSAMRQAIRFVAEGAYIALWTGSQNAKKPAEKTAGFTVP
jgi:hypothetical protein